MEAITTEPYKNDLKSFFTYLGKARIKAVTFQHTEERDQKLLDIVFEIPLKDGHLSEFLVRLETKMTEVNNLIYKLTEAVKNPKPHPWNEDLFQKAVTGTTNKEVNEELMRKYLPENTIKKYL